MANQATAPDRIDWRTVRDTINLAEVVARLLGPAPGRHGEQAASSGGAVRSTRTRTPRSAWTPTRRGGSVSAVALMGTRPRWS